MNLYTITWNANSELDISGYNIYIRYGNFGAYSLLSSVDKNSLSFTDNGVIIGSDKFSTNVFYKITAFDYAMNESDYTLPKVVTASGLNKEHFDDENTNTVYQFCLESSYPNPFNPTTTIQYSVGSKNYVSLKLYNSLGKEIDVLVSKVQNSGKYKITYNASHLTSGIYFLNFTSTHYSKTDKLILVK